MQWPKIGMWSAGAFVSMALVWSGTAIADAGLNMKPGLWETVTTLQGRAISTERKCYLSKDVAALLSQMRGELVEPAQPCKFADYKQAGNSVTYTMICTYGKGPPIRSAVTATYTGDASHGTVTTAGGVQSAIDSRRVDACTKSSF
jgi:hypothetical protein